MLQAPRLREVQQNEGFESCSVPTSTSQGSFTEMPHAGGFKESVPDINAVSPKGFQWTTTQNSEQKNGKYKSL